MAFINGTDVQMVESPIEKYLEFNKGQFQTWNKETKQNEIYPMDNFVVLDVEYTVKWKLWSDIEQKHVKLINSNAIKHFWQKLVVRDFNTITKDKGIVVEWVWKDIKPSLPSYAKLHIWVIVLDLNDMGIKEFFLSWQHFYNFSQFLKTTKPWEILKLIPGTMYTNGTKDENGNEVLVTEEFVNGLKWVEASKYKNRYTLKAENTGKLFEDMETLLEVGKDLDAYNEKKQTMYGDDTQEEVTIDDVQEVFYQPNEEQKKDIEEDKKSKEISIEEIPY